MQDNHRRAGPFNRRRRGGRLAKLHRRWGQERKRRQRRRDRERWEFHWHRIQAGAQASMTRFIGFDEEAGADTHQIRRRGGEWSAPEVIDEELIEAQARHSPGWFESKARATAALASLRRAERQVVRRARPHVVRAPRTVPPVRPSRARGRNEHRPGHRRATASRGPPDDGDGDDPADGDGDVLAPGVARTFSRPRAGAQLAAFLTLPEWQCQQARHGHCPTCAHYFWRNGQERVIV